MNDGVYVMTFGKYSGTAIDKVPASYLLWLWNNGMWQESRGFRHDPVRNYILKYFNHLETECPDIIVDHRP